MDSFPRPPEGPKKEARPPLEDVKTRLARVPRLRQIKLVQENPGPGQLTQKELTSMDPEGSGDSDCASAALMTAFINPGQFDKEGFLDSLIEEEEGAELEAMKARYRTTVDNMLEAGVLEENNGKIYSAVDFNRR